jgi:dihydroorotase
VIAPREDWVVTRASLRSQGQHSPYLDREVQGRVHATIVDGRVVYQQSR